MSKETPVLVAKKRDQVGSRYCRRIREQGGLPAVIYGHKIDPQPVTLDAKDAVTSFSKGQKVFRLDVDGTEEHVLLKDLGYDYLGTNIIHADLARVSLDERVDARAHITVVGDPIGLKKAGAVLMNPIHELHLNCLVTNLPDDIEVDISGLDVGEVLHAGDIELPVSTMKLLTDPEKVVAQIVVVQEEQKDEEIEVSGEEGQPELVDGKPEETEAGEGESKE